MFSVSSLSLIVIIVIDIVVIVIAVIVIAVIVIAVIVIVASVVYTNIRDRDRKYSFAVVDNVVVDGDAVLLL